MKKKLLLIFLTLLIFTISFYSTYANEANTIFLFPRINQVVASPIDDSIAIVTSIVKNKKWRYTLYLRNPEGKMIFLTTKNHISSVTWSKDGRKIYFLAKENRFKEIWMLNIFQKKPIKLIEIMTDINAFKLSPNEHKIAFVAATENSRKESPLVDVDHQSVNSSLYIADIPSPIRPRILIPEKPRILTPENMSVSQFFVYPGFDWSPNSQSIVFAYQPKAGAAYTNQNKIAIINIIDKTIKNIAYSESHNSMQPAFSPDGKWIAFQANPSKSEVENKYLKLNKPAPIALYQAQKTMICVANTSTFNVHCLSNTPNESPILIGWDASSTHVFVLDASTSTGYQIYALGINPAVPSQNVSNVKGFIAPLTITLNVSHQKFGFSYEQLTSPPEAYLLTIYPDQLTQVSHFQNPLKHSIGKSKVINWKSFDGLKIEGILFTPPDYNPNHKYPLLVAVHGGPAGAWSSRFLGGCDEHEEMIDPSSCMGNFLKLGFIVLAPNYRGSTGYGLDFRIANFADFGGGDYQDIEAGIDFLIKKNIADPDHIAIAGWSYGGFLTSWAISHSNRFKAAIVGDGNSDWISYTGTSSQPLFAPSYLGGYFWNNNHLYLQRSPIFYVNSITTPLLILHGEQDTRVPITQSFELFNALKTQNKSVKMFILPGQDHVPTDPAVIEESIEQINLWLKQALE